MTDCPACGDNLIRAQSTFQGVTTGCDDCRNCGRSYPDGYEQLPEWPLSASATCELFKTLSSRCGQPAVVLCDWSGARASYCYDCYGKVKLPLASMHRLFAPAPTAAAPAPAPQVSAAQMVCWICQTLIARGSIASLTHGKIVCSSKCGGLVVPPTPTPTPTPSPSPAPVGLTGPCPGCGTHGYLVNPAGKPNTTHCNYCGITMVPTAPTSAPSPAPQGLAAAARVAVKQLAGSPAMAQAQASRISRSMTFPEFVAANPPPPSVTTWRTCYRCDRELSAYLDAPVLKTDDPDLCRSCRKETTREQ